MNINNDSLVKFGERIMSLRSNLNLSQIELAKLCGMNLHSLRLLEKGRANISFLKIIVLSKALNLSPDELVTDIY